MFCLALRMNDRLPPAVRRCAVFCHLALLAWLPGLLSLCLPYLVYILVGMLIWLLSQNAAIYQLALLSSAKVISKMIFTL
jgi:hypothetical protein